MNFCPSCGASLVPAQRFCIVCGYNLEARTAAESPKPFIREFAELVLKKGAPAIIFILLLQVAMLVIISSLPFLPGEQAVYVQVQQQQTQGLASFGPIDQFVQILVNNMMIGLREIIPGFGFLWFGVASYNTSRIIEAISLSKGLSSSAVTTYLLILPHTWVELSAYAFALYEGAYITTSFFRRRGGKPLLATGFFFREVASSVLVLGVILVAAAALEVGEIQMGTYILLSWAPFAGLLLLLLLLRRRLVEPAAQPRYPPYSVPGQAS